MNWDALCVQVVCDDHFGWFCHSYKMVIKTCLLIHVGIGSSYCRVTDPPPIALFCLVPEQSDWQQTLPPPSQQGNQLLVTAELPRAQSASLRPTTASPPWCHPQININVVLLQRNHYFLRNPMTKLMNTMNAICPFPLCLSPSTTGEGLHRHA